MRALPEWTAAVYNEAPPLWRPSRPAGSAMNTSWMFEPGTCPNMDALRRGTPRLDFALQKKQAPLFPTEEELPPQSWSKTARTHPVPVPPPLVSTRSFALTGAMTARAKQPLPTIQDDGKPRDSRLPLRMHRLYAAPKDRAITLQHRRQSWRQWDTFPGLAVSRVPWPERVPMELLAPQALAPMDPRRPASWQRGRKVRRAQFRNNITRMSVCTKAKAFENELKAVSDASTAIDFLKNYIEKNHGTLKSTFQMLDIDNSGSLDVVELRTAFQKLGVVLSQTAWEGVIRIVDVDNSGQVEFQELLAAVRDHGTKKTTNDPSHSTDNAESSTHHGHVMCS